VDMGNEMLVDETICLVCGGSTFVGETISCETCLRWFHFNCVGVTHADPCVQSEDVPYFCPSCDVQNRRAKKAKRQSQVKDQKARNAAIQAEAARSEVLKNTSFNDVPVVGEHTSLHSHSLVIETGEQFGEEGLSIGTMGQSVIIADLGQNSNSYELGEDVGEDMKGGDISEDESEEEQLVIDTQVKHKGGKKDKSVVVTEMVPQVDVPICLLEQNNMVVGGNSEEEAWLEAVESGNIQKVVSCDSELRSLREPSMRTARQRALASGVTGEGDGAEELEMLDFGGKPAKVEKEMTEEDKVEKMVKAQKKERNGAEKREKMKQKTMDTLLKKKDSKVTKQIKTQKNFKEDTPKISYVVNSSGFSLSFPSGHDFPLAPSSTKSPPPPTLCSMCSNNKKYNSSKTGEPVCSLVCYKENLLRAAISA